MNWIHNIPIDNTVDTSSYMFHSLLNNFLNTLKCFDNCIIMFQNDNYYIASIAQKILQITPIKVNINNYELTLQYTLIIDKKKYNNINSLKSVYPYTHQDFIEENNKYKNPNVDIIFNNGRYYYKSSGLFMPIHSTVDIYSLNLQNYVEILLQQLSSLFNILNNCVVVNEIQNNKVFLADFGENYNILLYGIFAKTQNYKTIIEPSIHLDTGNEEYSMRFYDINGLIEYIKTELSNYIDCWIIVS